MVQIWTALVVTLLLEVLKRRSKYPWSFSRLRSYIRLNLMTYKDLNDWLWNLAVFGTGAINGWDKVKITHWDNSITAL